MSRTGIQIPGAGASVAANTTAIAAEATRATAAEATKVTKGALTLNVKDYGAVGDNTTDDSAAIQSAINACDPNRGGTVYFPQGRYRIATGLTVTYEGTVLTGEGQSGYASGAQGSSRIVSDDGITAITFNPGATPSHKTTGYGIRDLHVKAATGSTTGNGIVVQNAEGFRLQNVAVSDYIGGTGLLIDGKTGNAQYASLINLSGGDCLTVLKTQGTGPNGLRVFGARMDSGSTTPRASSIGIHLSTGDTARIFGAVVQGYATGIYVASSAVGHELFGPRVEYSNIGLRVGGSVSKFTLFGGSFNNNLLAGGGTNIGIQVDSGATGVVLMPTVIQSVGTTISDSGTGTVYPFTAGGAAALTSTSNYMSANVTMTSSGTYYDGPSVTLAAGTYLLTGSVQLLAGTTAIRTWDTKLWDGTTNYSSAIYIVTGTGTVAQTSIYSSAVVTLASSTTLKISVASTVGGDTLRGLSTKGSYLNAVKIA